MDCPKISKEREVLLDYCAGSLDAGRAAEFERHLAECGDCARVVAAQREVWESLDHFAAPEVSHDFDARLYARIAQEEAAPAWRRWLQAIMHPTVPVAGGFMWKPSLSVAALCAMLVFGLMLNHAPKASTLAPESTIHGDQVDIEQVGNALDELDLLMPGSQATPSAQAPHSVI